MLLRVGVLLLACITVVTGAEKASELAGDTESQWSEISLPLGRSLESCANTLADTFSQQKGRSV